MARGAKGYPPERPEDKTGSDRRGRGRRHCRSEFMVKFTTYQDKASAQSAIDRIKSDAAGAAVVDETTA